MKIFGYRAIAAFVPMAAIFQNGRHRLLLLPISQVLNHLGPLLWWLILHLQGQRIQWNYLHNRNIICYHGDGKIFVAIHIILMIHRHMMEYAVPRVQLHRFCATGISITIVSLQLVRACPNEDFWIQGHCRLSHNSDGGHFQKWPTPLTIIANISGSKPPRTMILVANTTFSRTRNPMELFTHDNFYFLQPMEQYS